MSYTIVGSKTSPFVRRIRMLLDGHDFVLKEVNIFDAEGSKELKTMTPLSQVPVLFDGDKKIYDSRIMFNYLNMIHRFENFDWEDENLLSIIDGGMNSGVNLMLLKRSGMSIDQDLFFLNRQRERIESVFDAVTPYAQGDGLHVWNFHAMSLYSLLDWGTFRELFSIDKRPALKAFLSAHKDRPAVINTAIPKI